MFFLSILFLAIHLIIPGFKHSLVFYHFSLWPVILILGYILGYSTGFEFNMLIISYYSLTVIIRLFSYKFYGSKEYHPSKRKIYDLSILLTLLLPFYINYQLNLYGLSFHNLVEEVAYSFAVLRQESVSLSGYGSNFNFFNNLVILANFNFLAALYVNSPKRITFSALLNIFYTSLLGSKMGIVITLLMIIIKFFYEGKFMKVIIGLCTTIFLFIGTIIIVNFTGDSSDYKEIIIALKSYIIGGPLSLDKLITANYDVGYSQVIYRPFIEILRSIGFDLDIGSRHMFYVIVKDFTTNVYSWFVSFYFNFNPLISMLIMTLYLIVLELISVLKKSSYFIKFIFPSLIIASIFSIHAEQLLSGFSIYIKLFLIFYFIKYVPSFSNFRWKKSS
tara:strand:+ start:1107 stop:2276 length:1170 start_codon:yes stop_codon:yes gene_type:complete